MTNRRPAREPRCPCGSGRLQRTCNPEHPTLIVCIGYGDDLCGRRFHQTSNASKRCELHALAQRRHADRERQRRRRQRQRAAADASGPTQLELGDVA